VFVKEKKWEASPSDFEERRASVGGGFVWQVKIYKIESLIFNMVDYVNIHVYTDGASRSNPGPSAIGIVFLDHKGNLIAEHKECIGMGTNNEAEYRAIIKALEMGTAYCRGIVNIFSDSELAIKQLTSLYAIKRKNLRILCIEIKCLERLYDKVNYNFAPRENKFVKRADELANEALDGKYDGAICST